MTPTISPESDAWIEAASRRAHRSVGAVAAGLLEEAVRMRRFLGIAFRGPDDDRRARMLGTAFDVWELVGGVRDFASPAAVLAASNLTEPQLLLALRYAEAYPDEIGRAIEANRLSEDDARRRYPALAETMKVREFPGIYFMEGATGRRARLHGGPDVWEVIEPYLHSERNWATLRECYPHVAEPVLRTALRYYEAYPEEIDATIARNNSPVPRT